MLQTRDRARVWPKSGGTQYPRRRAAACCGSRLAGNGHDMAQTASAGRRHEPSWKSMATKRGRIVGIEKIGPKFAQLRLATGDKVELPLDFWAHVQQRYRPEDELVFVERRGRIFSFVQWVGTDHEAEEAVRLGELTAREYSPALAPTHEARDRGPAAWSPSVRASGPASFHELVAQRVSVPVPSWMRDPRTDSNLDAFAAALTSATWGDWQVTHLRIEKLPRTLDPYWILVARIGEPAAAAGAHVASLAGTAVNATVLDYFVRQAEASQYDPRLVKTWLDILGAHEFKDGAVVSATWAVLMFDLLGVDVVAECYQPFARCVEPAVFNLEPL